MRESQNVGFGGFRDGITENSQWAFLTPLVRWMDCRWLEIQRGTFRGFPVSDPFPEKVRGWKSVVWGSGSRETRLFRW